MISTRKQYIVMMGLCAIIAFINLGTQAKGALVYGFVDDPDPGAIERSFATHIGIGFENTSATEVITITNVSLANLTILGGTYGNLQNSADILMRTNTGSIDALGNLASSFDINPGDFAFFTLQVNATIGALEYDRASYTGALFTPDETGLAASILQVTHHFIDGGAFGSASTGLDDVGAFSFEGTTSSVPEPSSVLLGAFGGILCLARRRR